MMHLMMQRYLPMAVQEKSVRGAARAGRRVGIPRVVGCILTLAAVANAKDFDPPPPDATNPVDYREWMNKSLSRHVEKNAFDTYVEASRRVTDFPGEWPKMNGWPKDNRAIVAWLRANREALTLFSRAARQPDCVFRWEAPGGSGDERVDGVLAAIQTPWLALFGDAARGLLLEGWRAWEAGDRTVLPDRALLVIRAAHHLCGSRLLSARIGASSDVALAYEAIVLALKRSDDPGGLAAMLAPRLAAADPPFPPFHAQIPVEKMARWDFAQRLFLPGHKRGTWKLHHPMFQWFLDQGMPLFTPPMQAALIDIGFDATVREISDYYDGMQRWTQTPYHQIRPDDRLRELTEQFHQISLDSRNPLTMKVMVPLIGPREVDEQIIATRRATHLIVHLFNHKRRHGAFPKSLAELAAADLETLRLDPFSGNSLVYAGRGNDFQLYSLSHNLADDGGKHQPWSIDGDYLFWPPRE